MEEALDQHSGDLLLVLHDGRELQVFSQFLAVASPVLRQALQCSLTGAPASGKRKRVQQQGGAVGPEEESAPADLPRLPVEGDFDGWTELIRVLYNLGQPVSLASAFKILPIAHTYDMRGLMRGCVDAVQQSKLPLGLPPVPAPEGPSLFQWLALADAKQCSPLVHACLGQLSAHGALPVVRSALSFRHSRARLSQLCPGTLMDMMNVVTGLPADFKGITVPDVSHDEPSFHKQAPMDTQHIAKATSACLCPPSLLLAKQVPGNVHTIEVHDVRTGTSFELTGHAAPIGAVGACSHQEQLALSGAGDGAVKLWCLASRECRLTLMQSPVSSVCFVGQRQVAVGCLDSVVKVWDVATGSAVLPDITGHEDSVNDVASTPDGSLLLSASLDKTSKLFDLRSGPRCVRTLEGHANEVWSCAMDAQGKVAVSAGKDGQVKVWELGGGRCTATVLGGAFVQMDAAGSTAISRELVNLHVIDLSRNMVTATHSWPGCEVWNMSASLDLSQVAVLSRPRGAQAAPWDIRVWSAN